MKLTNAGYYVSGGMLRDRVTGTTCLIVEACLSNPDELENKSEEFVSAFWHYYERFMVK